MTLLSLIFGLSNAYAIPVKLTQQGRLLDSNGAGITGIHLLHLRLFDNQSGGNLVWDESHQVLFNEGYYSVILGADSANPLEDSLLLQNPLYVEVEVDSGGPIGLRQEVVSAPYSRLAGTAANLSGGTVDAASVSVGSQLVIDSSGSWVGPAIAADWGNLQGIPADIADGDDDTLAGIGCSTGEILGWNGSAWACAADNGLTEAEVEAFVTNDAIDLHVNTTVGGLPILTQGDGDTLSGLSCQNGDVAKYDSVLGWQCDIDSDTTDWTALSNIPADIADGDDDTDTVLSESEVETFIVNGAIDLAADSTLNGQTILSASNCQAGELLSFNGTDWVCTGFQNLLDADSDSVMAWNDCDDTDPNAGSNVDNADCDAFTTAEDCNDFDPASVSIYEDGDCDGVLTADDCDDNDANSTTIASDNDCDGVLTNDDCNDNDANSTTIATDADCDGTLTADDCDDFDPASPTTAIDADCDGVPTTSDCDDTDPALMDTIGQNAQCPMANCKVINDAGFSVGDGLYWINPEGSAFQTWCDMTTDGGGWTMVSNNNNSDSEQSGCFTRVSGHSSDVCGSIAYNEDFTVKASGISFTEMVWAAYTGTFAMSSYQYLTWNSPQSIPTSLTWVLEANNSNQTLSGYSGLDKIYCTGYSTMNYVRLQDTLTGIASRNTVFSALLENAEMSFTDYENFSSGNVNGLDDWQDGHGCGDAWTPIGQRGYSSFVMIR